MINTKKCDLCLFLHKMCCKIFWKCFEIWKFLWELMSRWAKFCEILSHSVRYGMYDWDTWKKCSFNNWKTEWQILQNLIRCLLQEQSDLGLNLIRCLLQEQSDLGLTVCLDLFWNTIRNIMVFKIAFLDMVSIGPAQTSFVRTSGCHW